MSDGKNCFNAIMFTIIIIIIMFMIFGALWCDGNSFCKMKCDDFCMRKQMPVI